jgi:hypothetical protein
MSRELVIWWVGTNGEGVGLDVPAAQRHAAALILDLAEHEEDAPHVLDDLARLADGRPITVAGDEELVARVAVQLVGRQVVDRLPPELAWLAERAA